MWKSGEKGLLAYSVSAYFDNRFGVKLVMINLVSKKRSRNDDLGQLAKRVIGSVDLSSNPNWRSMEKINVWLKTLRKEYDFGN